MDTYRNPVTERSVSAARQPERADKNEYSTSWLTGRDPSSCQATLPGFPGFSGNHDLPGDHEVVRSLRLIRSAHARHHVRHLGSSWSAWDAFADHHHIDPHTPDDTHLVAFVEARARAGASWQTLNTALIAIRVVVEGAARLDDASTLTIAASRHLTDLFNAGVFDPAWQAPVLTVGHIAAMVAAAGPRDAFLVAMTYLAGLRPAEWTAINYPEHVQVDRRGVQMFLPDTKTGRWQKVAVQPLPGTPFDIVALAQAWLAERGTVPGPLLCEPDGSRLGDEHTKTRLRAAAAQAGVTEFSPYSLRRSMAVHADLLGVDSAVIRRRLRHTAHSQTYRRYIEPLLALFDRDGAAAHYLSPEPAQAAPVQVRDVRGGAGRLQPFAFADGSLDDLLDGLDLPGLRVPKRLAQVSRGSIRNGRRIFRRWAQWARGQGFDPTDPPMSALTRWVVTRQGEVDPVTVETELSSLRVGWLDATGGDTIPGWDTARTVAAVAADEARQARPPRYKSRPATAGDRAAVCAEAAPGGPPEQWAVSCLAWATGATGSIEVVQVQESAALVLADGVEQQVAAADYGLLDPVTAADVLDGAGAFEVGGSRSEPDVWKAGAGHSTALLRHLAVVLVAGSGTRPSDIARARVAGVSEVPGGLAVMLRASKGRRPSKLGRARLMWAPHRDGTADPVAAWNTWAQWHPAAADGPLLPRDVSTANQESKPMTPGAVSSLMGAVIAAAGLDADLTAYGFRYGRAHEMHEEGQTDESIAEALGHDDISVTRGYIQDFDPFADGLDDGFA